MALPQLGKYLPGKVLALAGHVAMAKGYGASGKVIASVLVLLQFLAILASILLSLAALALHGPQSPGAALPGAAAGNLPPPSAGVKPDADTGVRRAAQRLAERARETGNPTDVMAYMRARRARAG